MPKSVKKGAKSKPKSRKAAPKATKPVKTAKKATPKAEPPTETVEAVSPVPPTFPEHLLTLSFLRDDGEFCVRLEKNTGTMTELKNRSPDLLLRMVAGELEDLLG
jgi:hypothetical protein